MNLILIFTLRLHVMQRTVLRRSFCPPVCMSVCHACALWQNERNLCPHSYTISKKVYPSFPTRRMVGSGRPLVPKVLGQTGPFKQKRRF